MKGWARIRESPRAMAILQLSVLMALALFVGWWGPIPDYWRGFYGGVFCTYLICGILERKRERERAGRENALALRLEKVADRAMERGL